MSERTVKEETGLPSTEQAVRMVDVAEEKLHHLQLEGELSGTGEEVVSKSKVSDIFLLDLHLRIQSHIFGSIFWKHSNR